MELFIVLNNPNAILSGQGDYGSILWEGFAETNSENIIEIKRAGPFCPFLYEASGHLLCSELAKSAFEKAGLSGIKFSEVKISKVVRWDWEAWAAPIDIAEIAPQINEPEDLIELENNDPELLATMPKIWSIESTHTIKIRRTAPYKYETRHKTIEAYDVLGAQGDILTSNEYGGYIVTGIAKSVIEKICKEQISFIPLSVAN